MTGLWGGGGGGGGGGWGREGGREGDGGLGEGDGGCSALGRFFILQTRMFGRGYPKDGERSNPSHSR